MKIPTLRTLLLLSALLFIPAILPGPIRDGLIRPLEESAVLIVPVFSLLVFFLVGFIFIKFIFGSARKEDSIRYASERLRWSFLSAFPLMALVIFTSFLLQEFLGVTYPIGMGPDALLNLFFIFLTITVFMFTWGLRNGHERPREGREESERYKARFFVNLALHNFLLLGAAFFGYFDSTNIIYKSLVLFLIFWSLLTFMYFMEFIIFVARLDKYVYDDLFKKH
ncbi:MAG: hypothetical protein GOV00_00510 [Candidatus Altiarchaeota archaeon]|nr:hypothetical protein [Candidatus Altiarchaeota archaeon]